MFFGRDANIIRSLIMAPLDSTPAPFPLQQPVIVDFGRPRRRVPVLYGTRTQLKPLVDCQAGPGQGPLKIVNITKPAIRGECEINFNRPHQLFYTPNEPLDEKDFDDKCSYEVCDQYNLCGPATMFTRVYRP